MTSCYDCNGKKRGRTPEQAGMKLLRTPVKPRSLPPALVSFREASVPVVWTPYWQPT